MTDTMEMQLSSTETFTVICKDENGDAMDISGNDVYLDLVDYYTRAVVTRLSTIAPNAHGSTLVVTGPLGKIEGLFSLAETELLYSGLYEFDTLLMSAGVAKRPARVKVIFSNSVTATP